MSRYQCGSWLTGYLSLKFLHVSEHIRLVIRVSNYIILFTYTLFLMVQLCETENSNQNIYHPLHACDPKRQAKLKLTAVATG